MSPEIPAPGPTPEDIQHQMAGTRKHLGDQVQALGDKVMGMVHDASAAVAGAVQDGKQAAHDVRGAVEAAAAGGASLVKRALDVGGHVRRHPWAWVGGAVALGVACGWWTRRR